MQISSYRESMMPFLHCVRWSLEMGRSSTELHLEEAAPPRGE
jgi:hypothetical protein